MDLRDYIRDIPNIPKPGILFKDITPLSRSLLEYGTAKLHMHIDAIAHGARVLNGVVNTHLKATVRLRSFLTPRPETLRPG